MKSYYRIMLGANSVYYQECHEGSFIGADFGIDQDLSRELPDRWQEFNQKFRPIWLEKTLVKARSRLASHVHFYTRCPREYPKVIPFYVLMAMENI